MELRRGAQAVQFPRLVCLAPSGYVLMRLCMPALAALELLGGLLVRDPEKRLSAEEALNHSYFKAHLGWHAEEPRLLQVLCSAATRPLSDVHFDLSYARSRHAYVPPRG